MKQKRISAADATPIRVVIVTLDSHLASAVERANALLRRDLPGLTLSLHAVAEWGADPDAPERCRQDIAVADIVIATMLFMEEHVNAVLPWLQARRDCCDVMVACMSAAEIVRLTRIGRFNMDGPQSGTISLLKRLRGANKHGASAGARQLALVRNLPRILRFVPGTAQDLRAFFLVLQYWLAGSDRNVAAMVRFLVDRYADGPRRSLRGTLPAEAPIAYPDTGVYHPSLAARVSSRREDLPKPSRKARGMVGLLVMRSYVLAGNTRHYDAVIAALEARGFTVIPAFATGLDARGAVERFFMKNGVARVDAVVSLTGFSLVGGPAYNDARAAEEMLAALDVPYIAAHPVEFQTLEQWRESPRGLTPIEATMMVSIPELDGATGPIVFGGRSAAGGSTRDMEPDAERTAALCARVDRLIALRRKPATERKVGIILFNFPPDAGNVGTAAYLSVFASLHATLAAMQKAGYVVDLPSDVDELRRRILEGNSARHGTPANVHTRIPADQHVRRERWLREIEAQWGPAPGKQQSDGGSIFVLGAEFGNVFVGIQPSFGYEGDPMRLMFETGLAPTHAFSAFYRYLREDAAVDVVLHFGTHGALEFMPGKQTGLAADCWPDRLIGDLPNIYLYASNNPSEGLIAKRRAAATLVSYLTPPIAKAGLHGGLRELKDSLERWRAALPQALGERRQLAELLQAQAAFLDLAAPEPAWGNAAEEQVTALSKSVREIETTLIPDGLHVVGQPMSAEGRLALLDSVLEANPSLQIDANKLTDLVAGREPARGDRADKEHSALQELARINRLLSEDHELPALLRALDGRFIRPAPGGDLLRNAEVLPTGRNLHGFDPFRIPTAFALADGASQARRLLDRHVADGRALPETVAIVLWGTDNLKTEGSPVGQALALLGAKPRFDGFGRLAGADLIDLAELGRPRIDVLVTLSGIFRDLLPLQTKLLAEAAYLAAAADEPVERNFVRKHTLAYQAAHGCDLETAALRVFSNADGAYGSNVNNLIESGRWGEESELAETYTRRKSFAYGRQGRPMPQAALLQSVLANVDLAYQNLDSVELGITTIDHYFDTLGGISGAAKRARGQSVPVYVGDQTTGEGKVRSLAEQVAIETRTRVLNPKWYEGMLKHGYEGVRQIEAHVTNTVGWSATTGQVAPWVYQQISQTFMLDPEMRKRLADLNPTASAKVASRLIEAHRRQYWTPDPATLEALTRAGEELEDRIEGINDMVAA
ncbi:cobaltochelatase CobN subunit [Dongia mobilis]|uniref:magnesium chelatase n=1 Tax=Dongia mobilis TaxID=578943 RepID=A0A4R6WTI6_9PROT|nr:magnesium chelatase subunit H [Dongia mobilis]TDQ82953.1 cobaltochelatase CobN subunit [Dongia mobilis]